MTETDKIDFILNWYDRINGNMSCVCQGVIGWSYSICPFQSHMIYDCHQEANKCYKDVQTRYPELTL